MGLLGDVRGADGLWNRFRATPVAHVVAGDRAARVERLLRQLAGLLGLPFSFAHHFDMGGTLEAVELYREAFEPSPVLDRPHTIVTANVLAADTDEEAEYLAGPGRLAMLALRTGRPVPLLIARRGRRPPRPARRPGRCRRTGSSATPTQVVAGADELAERPAPTS